MGPRRASSLLAVLTIVASCYCCLTQAFLFPTGSYHGPSIVTTGKRRGGSPFTTETRRQIGPGWMPATLLFSSSSASSSSSSSPPSSSSSPPSASDSQKTMTPDEEIMEALIKMEWDDLEAFSNQHYKYLIHPQFYMKLADRIYELPTQAEQDEAAAKATKIWNRLLKVLEAAESVRASTAEVLEKIVAQAAESDGAFLFPLTKDRAVRAEVLKNLDRLDEGALTTLNSWMLKVQDDKDNAAMTEVLQRVFQFYAGGVLMRAKGYDRTGSDAGALVFLRNLLNADPEEWDMLLFNGLRVDGVCTVESLTDEVASMIQGVILSLPEGSVTQRVQAEFLRELMGRVNKFAERDPRAF
ncbi:Hypothetical protein NocV09_08200060 [Nannochloropsis oceanica]